MKQTMPLGRVAGIRIGAHWSVLVMVALIGWLLGAQVLPDLVSHQPAAAYWAAAVPVAVAFVAALLAHELAHSLVARRYGLPVTSITLWALGGVSELGGEPPTARADLLIAAAGGMCPQICYTMTAWQLRMHMRWGCGICGTTRVRCWRGFGTARPST